jgi:hypothetical protein
MDDWVVVAAEVVFALLVELLLLLLVAVEDGVHGDWDDRLRWGRYRYYYEFACLLGDSIYEHISHTKILFTGS